MHQISQIDLTNPGKMSQKSTDTSQLSRINKIDLHKRVDYSDTSNDKTNQMY